MPSLRNDTQRLVYFRSTFSEVHDRGGIVSFMKNIILLLSVVVLLGLCMTVYAADVDGTWESERPGRQGQGTMVTTYELQSNDSALTGKIVTSRGETPISEGKIEGDTISFSVVRSFGGNEMKILYKGKLEGDQITFTREIEGGFPGMGGPPPGGGAGAPGGGGPPPGGGAGGPGGGGPRPPEIAKRVK